MKIVDHDNNLGYGPFGEVLAIECVTKGIKGLVTNGWVRDSVKIRDLNFLIFNVVLSIKCTSKSSLGAINHPISYGSVVVNRGDLILGDDGVVVILLKEA